MLDRGEGTCGEEEGEARGRQGEGRTKKGNGERKEGRGGWRKVVFRSAVGHNDETIVVCN